MSIYTAADQRLLPENASQGHIVPRVMIFHSQGGTGSVHDFFLKGSNLESHFWVGLDGRAEQYIDSNVQADANFHANSFAISVETENHPGTTAWDDDPWSDAQIVALVRIGDWAAREHNIPRRLCPAWDSSGFGWHIQFGSPGAWTPVSKACPGARRIQQFQQIILPAIAGEHTANGEAMTDAEQLSVIAGVDKILKDDFQNLYTHINKDITNAANRVVRDLGGTPSVKDKK